MPLRLFATTVLLLGVNLKGRCVTPTDIGSFGELMSSHTGFSPHHLPHMPVSPPYKPWAGLQEHSAQLQSTGRC